MIVAAVAVTVAWQKLLVCGLPEASTHPTVVRYGDMPLVQISGKALNCNLIHEAGAIPAWGRTRIGRQGLRPGKCRLVLRRMTTSPHETRRGARPAAYSVNSELTDSSLEIRVIVSARS
jgi:hypothetical protein